MDLCDLSAFEPGAHGRFLMLPAARGKTRKRRKRGRQARSRVCDHVPCTCCRSVSRPSPTNPQLLTALGIVGVPVGRCARSSPIIPSWSAHATSSARTVASTLVGWVLRSWLSRRSCFIRLNTSSTCHRARYRRSTSANGQSAAANVVTTSNHSASHKAVVLGSRPFFWALRRTRRRAASAAAGDSRVASSRTP